MAKALCWSSIQVSPLHKLSLQRCFLGQNTPRNGCATPGGQKGAGGTTIAYLADHFATLGLSPGTSKQEIKSAFRRLALQYHPDVCKGDHCAIKFKQIKAAYESTMNVAIALSGRYVDDCFYDCNLITSEGLMGVNDDSWEEWEEWMGWEGAGTRDYSSHINMHL